MPFSLMLSTVPQIGKHQRTNRPPISSLPGTCGVNKLSDYCTSKFAAIGFEESIRIELITNGHSGVKSTVVMVRVRIRWIDRKDRAICRTLCLLSNSEGSVGPHPKILSQIHSPTISPSRQPWYIDTGMFEGVKVPIPLLEPNYAVERIIDAVLKDQMVLMMPRWVFLFVFWDDSHRLSCFSSLVDSVYLLVNIQTFRFQTNPNLFLSSRLPSPLQTDVHNGLPEIDSANQIGRVHLQTARRGQEYGRFHRSSADEEAAHLLDDGHLLDVYRRDPHERIDEIHLGPSTRFIRAHRLDSSGSIDEIHLGAPTRFTRSINKFHPSASTRLLQAHRPPESNSFCCTWSSIIVQWDAESLIASTPKFSHILVDHIVFRFPLAN